MLSRAHAPHHPDHARLTPADERALAGPARAGHIPSRDRLVIGCLALARMIARKYTRRGLDLDDLEQYARIGLIRATRTFDPDKGRFTTHAAQWIAQAIRVGIEDAGTLVRVPRHARQADRDLAAGRPAKGRRPTRDKDRAEVVGPARAALRFRGGDPTNAIGHVAVARPAHDALEHDDQVRVVLGLMGRLPARTARIIALRYGLGGQPPLTLKAAAAQLGLHHEYVRQIQDRAIEVLAGWAGARCSPHGPGRGLGDGR
jgi:RNA polymerase sigma factor (sigma-70 family)